MQAEGSTRGGSSASLPPAGQHQQQQQQQQHGVAPATAALLGAGSGALECRRFEVAGIGVDIRQDLKGSNALRPLDDDRVWVDGYGDDALAPPILTAEDLSRVGLVVWQAGFVLADYLLRRPPFGSWHGTQVLDLGCGTGLVGILLALAGAEVTLTDQPHVAALAEQNARANLTPGLHRLRTVPFTWGDGDAAQALLPASPLLARPPQEAQQQQQAPAASLRGLVASPPPPPLLTNAQHGAQPAGPSFDVITAADVVYQPECYATLAATLRQLAAPHTLVFTAFKQRGLKEDSFLELLEGAGFALEEVPQRQLAEEYQGGSYRVVRACRIE